MHKRATEYLTHNSASGRIHSFTASQLHSFTASQLHSFTASAFSCLSKSQLNTTTQFSQAITRGKRNAHVCIAYDGTLSASGVVEFLGQNHFWKSDILSDFQSEFAPQTRIQPAVTARPVRWLWLFRQDVGTDKRLILREKRKTMLRHRWGSEPAKNSAQAKRGSLFAGRVPICAD